MSTLWILTVISSYVLCKLSLFLFLNRVEISQRVLHQSYSLILGINMTAALFLQTILTLILTDNVGLALSSRDQVNVWCF